MDSSSDDEAVLPHESGVELDETGTAEPYAKQSASGGLGLFARGKPRPIEYRRDPSLPNGGFLSADEADALWGSQSELSAQYLMEVGLDTQWYRDEVTAGGALRPITHISKYVEYGQRLDWDEETVCTHFRSPDVNMLVATRAGSACKDLSGCRVASTDWLLSDSCCDRDRTPAGGHGAGRAGPSQHLHPHHLTRGEPRSLCERRVLRTCRPSGRCGHVRRAGRGAQRA
jgi:hypothetical protein